MSQVARPSFYEGQVLSAADLDLGQEYGRAALSRHERYLHTPGIATGLELKVDNSTGAVQVTLSAGMAIDGNGRQIVVDRQETLAAEDLDSQGVLIPADTDSAVKQEDRPWHPVFLNALDESATPVSLARGCGAGAQPNRMQETYGFTYGFPGEPAGDGSVAAVSDGPQPSATARVLIGYVQWDGASNFFDAKAAPPKNPPTPYAGVRADEVVARDGTLALRADLGATHDKHPALILDGDKGGEMRFGLQNEKGEIVSVFSVDSAGNLTLSGVIKGPISDKSVWAESGTVTDGMLIPLPAGVPQDKVDSGQIVLHITVSPRNTGDLRPPDGSAGTWFKQSLECRVDGRRVYCRERWFDVSNLPAPKVFPAACDYVIVASTAGTSS